MKVFWVSPKTLGAIEVYMDVRYEDVTSGPVRPLCLCFTVRWRDVMR